MSRENEEKIRERILSLIDSEFDSDAAFERAANLPPKTVNNWRRNRSSSYMKMLPELATLFGVSVRDLLNTEEEADGGIRLTAEEQAFLSMFRAAEGLSERERAALNETIKNTIDLYLASRGTGHGK